MTHCAMLSKKYERFILNDISPYGVRLFMDSLQGKYANETRWISRENFIELKDTDAYVRLCWSFGNNGRNYIYSKEIEPFKKAMHFAVVLGDIAPISAMFPAIDFNSLLDCADSIGRNQAMRNVMRNAMKNGVIDTKSFSAEVQQNIVSQNYQQKCNGIAVSAEEVMETRSHNIQQRCANIQNKSSQKTLRLQSMETYNLDYKDVVIPSDSVVYCDPPYAMTDGYGDKKHKANFDTASFLQWAKTRDFPVFISEYRIEDDDFTEVLSIMKQSKYNKNISNAIMERLYVQRKFADFVTMQRQLELTF